MPFDGTVYQANSMSEAAHARWSVNNNRKREPRNITPLSDTQALYAISRYMETRWAKKLNDGENHCVVGWVVHLCEPTTVIDWQTPQIKRLLQRLHDALPKPDRLRRGEPRFALARYNDTKELQEVRELVMQAYLAAVNAEIDKLNG